MTDIKDQTMKTIEHLTEEKDSLKEKTEDKEVLKEDTMATVINDEQSFITTFLVYFRLKYEFQVKLLDKLQ